MYDEIYEKVIWDNNKHISFASLPGMRDRTLTINGYSKAYAMTGYRIGYICGPEYFISTMSNMHSHLTHSPSVISQKVAEVTYSLDSNVYYNNISILIIS